MPRPKTGLTMLTRSYRIEEKLYDAARSRAKNEETNINQVISNLVEGYARGVYELPRVHTVREFPAK